jgi:hypothetical protein
MPFHRPGRLKAMTRLTEFGKDDKSGGAGSSKSLWGIGNKVRDGTLSLLARTMYAK